MEQAERSDDSSRRAGRRGRTVVLFLCIVLALIVSCSGRSERDHARPGRPQVVATLFPVYDFARQVAGTDADVFLLLPPGVEPHGYEPSPSDVLRIRNASLFLYTNDRMEPWARSIVPSAGGPGPTVLKVGDIGDDPAADAHVWLDFSIAGRMVDVIAAGLAGADPAHAAAYRENALRYREKLDQLDRRFAGTLARCRTRTLVSGGHAAFGRLADRYGLEHISAVGASPDAEPTLRGMVSLTKLLKQRGITVVFSEELLEPRLATVLAREANARVMKLHAAHNLSQEERAAGATFLSLMEQNLAVLEAGLACSP